MLVNNVFEIGETVYLITDPDQYARLVYCVEVYRNEILYKVVCGSHSDSHYDFELSRDKNSLQSLTS